MLSIDATLSAQAVQKRECPQCHGTSAMWSDQTDFTTVLSDCCDVSSSSAAAAAAASPVDTADYDMRTRIRVLLELSDT